MNIFADSGSDTKDAPQVASVQFRKLSQSELSHRGGGCLVSNPFLFCDLSGPFPFMRRQEVFETIKEEGMAFALEVDGQCLALMRIFDSEPEQERAALEVLNADKELIQRHSPLLGDKLSSARLIRGITRLHAQLVRGDSPAKAALLEALGFKCEGILRSQVFVGGCYHDLEIWGWSRLWNQ